MQKSEELIFGDPFSELIGLTDEITEILSQDSSTDLEKISSLSRLYDQRAFTIEKIKKWTESEEGQQIINNNNEDWHSFLGIALQKEKYNVDNINEHVQVLEKKLRDLPKQRQLLIYTRSNL